MNPPEKFEKEVDEIMDRIEDDEAFLERCTKHRIPHSVCLALRLWIVCLALRLWIG